MSKESISVETILDGLKDLILLQSIKLNSDNFISVKKASGQKHTIIKVQNDMQIY
jgi:hypothetical protein